MHLYAEKKYCVPCYKHKSCGPHVIVHAFKKKICFCILYKNPLSVKF